MSNRTSVKTSEISSIYKSRCILLELLKEQNYNTSDYEGFSVNEINAMRNNKQLDMILEKNEENELTKRKNKIYIQYYLEKSLRPQNLQETIDDLFNIEEVLSKNDTLLIITKDEVNETLINNIKHIWEQDGIFLIIIFIKRLQFNILKHVLVPHHRVLNNIELNEIKKKYNILSDNQFPEISRFDPVAQVIGIRPGEVCEITRSSKNAITSKYYRICV
jgi:DNA-directed RNA polymerase subunit H